jgi:hypothetical protein
VDSHGRSIGSLAHRHYFCVENDAEFTDHQCIYLYNDGPLVSGFRDYLDMLSVNGAADIVHGLSDCECVAVDDISYILCGCDAFDAAADV